MCFYIICSIHMRATQLSQCTFCDPSVRLQEQRKKWHFSQALTAPNCPLLFKSGALPCQKSHPLESRQREIQPILISAHLLLIQSPDQYPEILFRSGLSTFHISHARFCFVSWLPLAEVMMDVVLQPLGSAVQENKRALAVVCMSMQVGNNIQEGVLRLNTL